MSITNKQHENTRPSLRTQHERAQALLDEIRALKVQLMNMPTSEHAKLDSIRDLCQSSLEIDGSSKPGVDLASVLSQILNIATNGQEGDKPKPCPMLIKPRVYCTDDCDWYNNNKCIVRSHAVFLERIGDSFQAVTTHLQQERADTDVLELATLSERLDTVIQEMRVVGATPSLMNELVGISAEIRLSEQN